MVDALENVSIGNELKDGYKRTDKWFTTNLLWLNDIEYFYKQRAIIEKEYSVKLQALCSDSFKRKAKVSTIVSVGDDPVVTPGSLENSTLTVWNDILNKTELIAKDKQQFADKIDRDIVNKISQFKRNGETLQKKYGDLNTLIIKEKDSSISDLKKSKHNYDAACQDMESVRQKTEKSSRDKLTKKLNDKEVKMNICKNNYLIKINQTNRLKDKYLFQDLPEILDGLQDLNEFKTIELNKLWKNCINIEKSFNDQFNEHLLSSLPIIQQNNHKLDTVMFIKHNLASWKEPVDFYYEPSPIWHDDDKLITKPDELNELRKRLDVANRKYIEHDKVCENLQVKISEINQLKNEMKHHENEDIKYHKSIQYYVDENISCLKTFVINDNIKVSAEVEMEYIQNNSGNVDLTITSRADTGKKKGGFGFLKRGKSKSSHNEVSSGNDTDSISTNTSNYTGNEQNRPVSSNGGGPIKSLTSRFRQASITSSSSSQVLVINEGKALYDYQATADDEATVKAGETFEVMEVDDGSGWTKVQKNNGIEGLVPTTYLVINQVTRNTSIKSSIPPPVAPKRGAKKVPRAKVLYDYTAEGDDELTIKAGDIVVILENDDGGGWTKGESKGLQGLFPTSYVQML